jgi:hypothetical protein
MDLPFIQRVIVAAWKTIFSPGGPTSGIPDPWSLPDMPSSPNSPNAEGFDLSTSVPDILGMITMGAAAIGNARGFLTGGSVTGLSKLAPKVDPAHEELAGLTFSPATGSPTAMTCRLKIASLSLGGGWTIKQDQMSATGGGCGSGPMLAMAGHEPSEENLDRLREVRTDLLARGGRMGQWYVDEYNTNQDAIQALLEIPEWKQAVDQYNGNQVWGAILASIRSGSSVLTADDLSNAIALVSAAQQVSPDEHLVNTLGEMIGYLSDYQSPDGQSYGYDRILEIVASQTPPAPQQRMRTPALRGGPVFTTARWSGSLSASASDVTATATFSIAVGTGGAAPTLTCTDFQLGLPSWNFSYSGSDFSSKFLVWAQQTFSPSATGGINDKITDEVNGTGSSATTHQKIIDFLTEQTNAYVTRYWNNPPA